MREKVWYFCLMWNTRGPSSTLEKGITKLSWSIPLTPWPHFGKMTRDDMELWRKDKLGIELWKPRTEMDNMLSCRLRAVCSVVETDSTACWLGLHWGVVELWPTHCRRDICTHLVFAGCLHVIDHCHGHKCWCSVLSIREVEKCTSEMQGLPLVLTHPAQGQTQTPRHRNIQKCPSGWTLETKFEMYKEFFLYFYLIFLNHYYIKYNKMKVSRKLWIWFSFSIFTWVLETKLRSSGLHSQVASPFNPR